MSEPQTVAVLTVTYDSADQLPEYFDALAELAYEPLEVVLVDCGSADGSVRTAEAEAARSGVRCAVHALGENRGFAGGMNEALRQSTAPYVLALNPDARPEPEFVHYLVENLERDPRAAAATGKLLRPGAGHPPTLDACGMRLTRTWRHLDRGSGELDDGRFDLPEQVFGATGAAVLYRRSALEDVAIDSLAFDEDFHSYREDAELCFRFHERGWKVIFEPRARAEHRRFNLPSRRSQMPPEVNYHSLKNRYLLRLYHQTARNLLTTALPTFARDLGALAWVLTRERSSLPAYGWLWRNRREILARRKRIKARVTRPSQEVDRWFTSSGEPL